MSAREAGLIPNPRQVPVAIFMVPVGLAIGVIAYLLLDPRTLGRELAFGGVGLVALIVILNPGIVDEIVFRGVLQRAITGVLGSSLGVLYTALLYAPVLPAGLVGGGSLLAVVLTFGIGLLLSIVTLKTGSVLSAIIGHASLALGLFVLGPYLVGGVSTTAGTPAMPPIARCARPNHQASPRRLASHSAASGPGHAAAPGSPNRHSSRRHRRSPRRHLLRPAAAQAGGGPTRHAVLAGAAAAHAGPPPPTAAAAPALNQREPPSSPARSWSCAGPAGRAHGYAPSPATPARSSRSSPSTRRWSSSGKIGSSTASPGGTCARPTAPKGGSPPASSRPANQ